MLLVCLDQSLDSIQLVSAEAVTAVQPDGIEPELGFAVVALHVHVRWLVSVTCIEEEPVWAASENGWHPMILRRLGDHGKSPLRSRKGSGGAEEAFARACLGL